LTDKNSTKRENILIYGAEKDIEDKDDGEKSCSK